jgi:uncharacterized protein (DUF885 family)
VALAIDPSAGGPSAEGADAPSPFAAFVEDYFDAYFSWKPSEGTAAGLHKYDDRLEDGSAEAAKKRVETVKGLQARLEKLREGKLNGDEAIDAEVLDGLMKAELLDLEVVRTWRKNPMGYIATPPGAVNGLMKRDFAPAATRLRSVIARLTATPAMFAALQGNVDNPPKEFTDLAIRMGEGSIGFYRDTVRDWATGAAGTDADLLKEFDAANDAVVKSLTETVAWMKKDLLPKSKGKYALGAETFAKQLLYKEMVDIPLDKLLAVGEANLKRDQEAFRAVAEKIDAKKTPAEVMRSLSDDLHIRPPGAVAALLRYLPNANNDESLEEEIWYGLDSLTRDEGKIDPALLAALKNIVPVRRAAAACIVGHRGNEEQRAEVRKLLADPDPPRAWAAS